MRPAIEQLIQKGYPVKSDRHRPVTRNWPSSIEVKAVPTFIVVDAAGRTLARTGPAARRQAGRTLPQGQGQDSRRSRPAVDDPQAGDAARRRRGRSAAEDDRPDRRRRRDRRADPSRIPSPGRPSSASRSTAPGSIGFGSGTIIHSTPEESIILTCAHIFKLEGGRRPSRRRSSRGRSRSTCSTASCSGQIGQVHYANETVDGQGARLRLRPRRRPDPDPARAAGCRRRGSSPPHWQPQQADADDHRRLLRGARRHGLGHDDRSTRRARALGQPAITRRSSACRPRSRGGRAAASTPPTAMSRASATSPSRGATTASTPRPASIHRILDRNNLTALYAAGHEPIRADARPGTRPTRGTRRRPRPSPAPSRPTATSRPRDDPAARPAGNPVADRCQGSGRTDGLAIAARHAPRGRARCPDGRAERRDPPPTATDSPSMADDAGPPGLGLHLAATGRIRPRRLDRRRSSKWHRVTTPAVGRAAE